MPKVTRQERAAAINVTGIVAGAAEIEYLASTKVLTLASLTTTERDALTAANGMLIYNSTLNKFQGYENGAWTNLI